MADARLLSSNLPLTHVQWHVVLIRSINRNLSFRDPPPHRHYQPANRFAPPVRFMKRKPHAQKRPEIVADSLCQ